MTLQSKCYFYIYTHPEDFVGPHEGGTYNTCWSNFLNDFESVPKDSVSYHPSFNVENRIKKWNGTIINNSTVLFESEQDKVWFMLKWS